MLTLQGVHRRMTRLIKASLPMLLVAASLAAWLAVCGRPASGKAPRYRSPFDVAYSPDGTLLAASDFTSRSLAVIDAASSKIKRQVKLDGKATGVAWRPTAHRSSWPNTARARWPR